MGLTSPVLSVHWKSCSTILSLSPIQVFSCPKPGEKGVRGGSPATHTRTHGGEEHPGVPVPGKLQELSMLQGPWLEGDGILLLGHEGRGDLCQHPGDPLLTHCPLQTPSPNSLSVAWK